jgi:hypothetical protein
MFACNPDSGHRIYLQLIALIWVTATLANPIDSTAIAPGVVFDTYRFTTPNDVFVLSIERNRPEYEFRVAWPGGDRNFTSRATATAIIASAQQEGLNVIGGVNASFFSFDSIDVTGVTASNGQIVHPPSNSHDTAIIGTDRLAEILEDIAGQNSTLTMPTGNAMLLHGYNRTHPSTGQLTLYTDEWGLVRHSLGGAAIAVVMDSISGPPRAKREFSGQITEIRTLQNASEFRVPAGGAVLLGDTGITPLTGLSLGDELTFKLGASVNQFNNLNLAITGVGRLLHNGSPDTTNWAQYSFSNVRHPRTVFAWNATHWFLMVVDGRSDRSVGMTFTEMADFLTTELQATDALNLDGGGSSTMVVDGIVRNVPSDGRQRAIANALLLISEDPPTTTVPFAEDFSPSGRRSEWDDKFTINPVESITTPSGDNSALVVADPAGGVETARAGRWGDRNYAIQAEVFCEYRPEDASNGLERYALFARDSGTGALGLTSYGSGNCYALTCDSHNGQFLGGMYSNGAFGDLSSGGIVKAETAWRLLRIECFGDRIRYLVDGELIADVTNTVHTNGQFGIGYHEFFNDNNLINGTRVDSVVVTSAFGDSDANNAIDFYDTQAQAFCLSGPDDDFLAGFFCRNSDLDGDADVDIHDTALLQQFYGLTAP